EFYRSLCIPIIISKRPDWDKFPGADYTIAVDTIMPNGKTLQIGTVHHLGDHFSRTFAIRYEDKNGEQKVAYQTCYGISERCIAALISVHGDDKGLILPPAVATFQAVIVPITIGKRHDDVLAAAEKLKANLEAAGLRVMIDNRDMRPGAKYYWWELRAKAEEHMKSRLYTVNSMDGLNAALNEGKVAVVQWCRDRACGDAIEEKANSSLLGTEVRSDYVDATDGPCIICNKPGKATLVGRTY